MRNPLPSGYNAAMKRPAFALLMSLAVAASVAAQADRPPTLDGDLSDWPPSSMVYQLSSQTRPGEVTSYESARVVTRPIAQSRFWPAQGSAVDRLHLLIEGSNLWIAAVSDRAFADGASIRFFFFTPDTREAEYLLRIDRTGSGALVSWWDLKTDSFVLVGEAAAGDFALEARIGLDEIDGEVFQSAWPINFYTTFTGLGVTEEFFLGSFATDVILRR